jgi:hypothetical protein
MQPLTEQLQQLITNAQQSVPSGLSQATPPAGGNRFRRKGGSHSSRPQNSAAVTKKAVTKKAFIKKAVAKKQ